MSPPIDFGGVNATIAGAFQHRQGSDSPLPSRRDALKKEKRIESNRKQTEIDGHRKRVERSG